MGARERWEAFKAESRPYWALGWWVFMASVAIGAAYLLASLWAVW